MPSRANHTMSATDTQAPSSALDLWETEVVPHLPADLEEQARILGAFQRRRALASATSLLRALLASVLVTTSLQHLACWAVVAEVATISCPAWHKRLLRSRAWLEWLLAELLFAPPSHAQGRLFPHAKGNILLVDATCLGQDGGTGDDWRLHTAYNFTVGRLAQVRLTDTSGGEHLGYYRLKAGDIVVADNGYGYRRSVALARIQQAHVVIRVRPATFPFEQADGQVVDVVTHLRRADAPVLDLSGWCTDTTGERYRVRLVAAKLPKAQAQEAQRRARRNAQKHGRNVQAQTLLVAGWVVVITTLPAEDWQAEAVLRLYRVRWQIERLFKRMKSILHLASLRGRTAASIEVSLLALLVAWALQETEANWVRHELKLMTGMAMSVVSSWTVNLLSVDVLRQQVRGGWGSARLHSCLAQLERFVSSQVRQDRQHQESAVRHWLERRPTRNLIFCHEEQT